MRNDVYGDDDNSIFSYYRRFHQGRWLPALRVQSQIVKPLSRAPILGVLRSAEIKPHPTNTTIDSTFHEPGGIVIPGWSTLFWSACELFVGGWLNGVLATKKISVVTCATIIDETGAISLLHRSAGLHVCVVERSH